MARRSMKLREIAKFFPGRTIYGIHRILKPKARALPHEIMTMKIMASLDEQVVRPPTHLVFEAIARERAPRTPTMWICGDPVLNQCALFGIGRRLAVQMGA
jgi:hypothetical protein